MLRAFTIMELMIVSILTVITVGAAFTAYEIIQRQFTHYHHDATRQLDLQELQSLLLEDIYRAKTVNLQGNQLSCQLATYELRYYPTAQQIVRAVQLPGVRADTFPVQMVSWEGRLDQLPVSFGRVDKIQINLDQAGTIFPLIFTKTYGVADQLPTE